MDRVEIDERDFAESRARQFETGEAADCAAPMTTAFFFRSDFETGNREKTSSFPARSPRTSPVAATPLLSCPTARRVTRKSQPAPLF
ncbi:hypothetical protein [Bradyrhizobium sp. STM 3562]|uniref:hypothetical protein n=1 Tax=Bradyrhizobium sp. STM 3562 TaxID=578924 RepID=UPI00388D768B